MDVEARGNFLGRFVPARYIVTILSSIGISIVYGMKVNLSMAMVGMLNHTALRLNNSVDENLKNFTDTVIHESDYDDGPFVWTSNVQGFILSGYYWGYLVSQIPGGRAAELFSAKWVMLFSVGITASCTMLSPVMAETHYIALTCMRVLEGVGGGVSFPAVNVLLSKWSPSAERTFMAVLAYSGAPLGTVLSILMTGILTAKADSDINLKKDLNLKIATKITKECLTRRMTRVVLVQDSPQKQPFISVEERNMIIVSLDGNIANRRDKKLPVPWRAVLTSPAFLAILVAHSCSNWGWFMFITELPFYMKQVLHFNMTENTLYVAPPFVTMWLFASCLSKTLDWLRARRTITMTTARKIGTFIASAVPSMCLIALCYIGNNRAAAVVIMGIGITFLGGQMCGIIANHMDIAPNFAGTLFAIANTVGTIPGIIVPLFAGAVTHNNQTIEAWRIVFLVTVGVYTLEFITFLTFGSGEVQPWNKVIADKAEDEILPLNEHEKKTNL